MKREISMTLTSAALTALISVQATAQTTIYGVRYYDLTHVIPTFAATGGDVTKPDMTKPMKNLKTVASFEFQATRKLKDPLKTQKGFFQWAWFHFDEHYTTYLDSPDHYLNNDVSANSDKRSVEEYTLRDIIGPVVYIDIFARVTKELAKNGDKPSPNPGVTNFGEATGATVLASYIEQVADKIVDRTWIVVHSG